MGLTPKITARKRIFRRTIPVVWCYPSHTPYSSEQHSFDPTKRSGLSAPFLSAPRRRPGADLELRAGGSGTRRRPGSRRRRRRGRAAPGPQRLRPSRSGHPAR